MHCGTATPRNTTPDEEKEQSTDALSNLEEPPGNYGEQKFRSPKVTYGTCLKWQNFRNGNQIRGGRRKGLWMARKDNVRDACKVGTVWHLDHGSGNTN